MESVADSDFCILVTEPTAFGFHNFEMVYELVTLLQKPCGVVINKADSQYEPLEIFCKQHQIPVLLRIPYRKKLAQLGAEGHIASDYDEEVAQMFIELLERIRGERAQ